jgi:energy-coupling factor transporter transmembrane protein EcfT
VHHLTPHAFLLLSAIIAIAIVIVIVIVIAIVIVIVIVIGIVIVIVIIIVIVIVIIIVIVIVIGIAIVIVIVVGPHGVSPRAICGQRPCALRERRGGSGLRASVDLQAEDRRGLGRESRHRGERALVLQGRRLVRRGWVLCARAAARCRNDFISRRRRHAAAHRLCSHACSRRPLQAQVAVPNAAFLIRKYFIHKKTINEN